MIRIAKVGILSSLLLLTEYGQAQTCTVNDVKEWWKRTHGEPFSDYHPAPDAGACATDTAASDRFEDLEYSFFETRDLSDVSWAVSSRGIYWNPGEKIQVCFVDGARNLQELVIEAVESSWEKYANIDFVFDNNPCGPAGHDIRVSLAFTNRSWSKLGTASRSAALRGETTLQLGWLADRTIPKSRQMGTIIHEFGHALGLNHEHQNPNIPITYDPYKTYIYFARTNGWCPETTYHNVLSTRNSGVDATLWDKQSIMHYPISSEITTNGVSVQRSHVLSAGDKMWAAVTYPPKGRTRSDSWKIYEKFASQLKKLPTYVDVLAQSSANARYLVKQEVREASAGSCRDCGLAQPFHFLDFVDASNEIQSVRLIYNRPNNEAVSPDGDELSDSGFVGPPAAFKYSPAKKTWEAKIFSPALDWQEWSPDLPEDPEMTSGFDKNVKRIIPVHLRISFKDGRPDYFMPYNLIDYDHNDFNGFFL
jgi:hypothetical protein